MNSGTSIYVLVVRPDAHFCVPFKMAVRKDFTEEVAFETKI